MDDFQGHGITCCHCLVWDAQAVGGWLVGQQRWAKLKTFKKKKVRTDGRIGNVGIFKFFIYIYTYIIYIYLLCSIQVLFQVIPEISSSSWKWNTAAGTSRNVCQKLEFLTLFSMNGALCNPMKLYEFYTIHVKYTSEIQHLAPTKSE